MAMIVDCPPVPVPQDEETEITDAAHKARSAPNEKTDFESISVKKCITRWELYEDEHIRGRREIVTFSGRLPHIIQTDRYRERYSVNCHTTVEFQNNTEVKRRHSCTEELERYMQYDDIEHEVRLRGPVSIEHAKAYLDFLMQYDFGAADPNIVRKSLRKIEWVESSTSNSRVFLEAGWTFQGCGTATLESSASLEQPIEFGSVSESSSIC